MPQKRTRCRSLRKEIFAICLLCAWVVQLASPQSSSISSIQELICRGIPGLNKAQVKLCIDVPRSIEVLKTSQKMFAGECSWQFRNELWNCSGVDMPIFSAPQLTETKESAFVYALTSALTVHQITTGCSNGFLAPYCACDISRNGFTTPAGWKWGSCSDNISSGITFAQNFLDSRELNKTASTNNDEVAMAEVNLHNNAVGRRVVDDGMKLACKCHGFSGSCSVKTCWRELPSVYEIGDTIKEQYNQAIKVEIYFPNNSGRQAQMRYYSEERGGYVVPTTRHMVYLKDSPRYCDDAGNFTRNRLCMPKSALSSDRFYDTAMNEFYPPCEEFCCNGHFEAYHKTEVTSCNCTFVWCCEVECQTCVRNVTEYKCTG